MISAVPADSPVTKPEVPTFATFVPEVSDSDQVTYRFSCSELPSVHAPVAVYCFVAPGANTELAGVRESDWSVPEPTFSSVEPVALLKTALMVAVADPVPAVRAMPWLPTVLLMLTTVVSLECHCTLVVMSWVEESLKSPIAVNAWCQPIGTVCPVGVTEMDRIAAFVTVKVVDPDTEPKTALMVIVPGATPNALPLDPNWRIKPDGSVGEDQVT